MYCPKCGYVMQHNALMNMHSCFCGMRLFENIITDKRTETIQKRRAGRYGHPQTEATKQKIRQTIINKGGVAA